MGRRDDYRRTLRGLDRASWPAYLTKHSNLPGPRGNLELAQAVADEGDAALFDALVATDDEYLTFCGVLGLGQLLAASTEPARRAHLAKRLSAHAGDERWRARSGGHRPATGGRRRPAQSHRPRGRLGRGPGPLVGRAAVAAICEPRLLVTPAGAAAALAICDRLTATLAALPGLRRRDPGVRTLRQALGYCWSVAVAADPPAGLPRFRSLAASTDSDLAWIVQQNERKSRLAKLL